MNLSLTRSLVVALTSIALSITCLAPAVASDSNSSSSSGSGSNDTNKSAWVATAKVYKAALLNREVTVQAINDEFTKAVKRAKKDLTAALTRAATPALKSAAATRYKDAIDRATAIRQAALDALPSLPPLPGAKVSSK